MRVKTALRRWLRVKAPNWSEKTRKLVGGWGREWGELWRRNHKVLALEVSALDHWDMESLMLYRVESGRAPSSVNHERRYVRQFVRWCIDRGSLERDVTSTWRPLGEPEAPVRVLGQEGQARLLTFLRTPVKELTLFAVETGLRLATIRRVAEEPEWDWDDDNGHRWVTIPPGVVKNRRGLSIPLSPRAREALAGLRGSSLLAVNSTVWRQFKRGLRRAGLDPAFRFHDLRKTFTQRLRDRGVAAEDVQELGGWRSKGVMLKHYYGEADPERLVAIVKGSG